MQGSIIHANLREGSLVIIKYFCFLPGVNYLTLKPKFRTHNFKFSQFDTVWNGIFSKVGLNFNISNSDILNTMDMSK